MSLLPVSTLILYTPDRKILLQHRDSKTLRSPNTWGIFGGGIEDGETPKEALKREIMEEIEYQVREPELILTELHQIDGEAMTEYLFAEEYDGLQPIVLHEGQGFGWFMVEEALALPIAPHRRTVFKKLTSLLGWDAI